MCISTRRRQKRSYCPIWGAGFRTPSTAGGQTACRIDAPLLNVCFMWTKESKARGDYYVEVADNQSEPGWKYKYTFSDAPVDLAGSFSPSLPDGSLGDSFTVYDIMDSGDDFLAKINNGDASGLGSWRFQKWRGGLDYHDEHAVPLNVLALRLMVGDLAVEDIDPMELAEYLRVKLSPLVSFLKNPDVSD